MDNITKKHFNRYQSVFEQYGPTAKGVDWGDEVEFLFRHKKILDVLKYASKCLSESPPSLLDVGCGWGALYSVAEANGVSIDYTGIDIVGDMIDYASKKYSKARFVEVDIFSWPEEEKRDFVVCNGIMTQKHTDTSNIEMEDYCHRLIKKMFNICRYGIAFNMMSNRVNYMAPNLYYQSPTELLGWLLSEISPRVVIDHGYSSLGREKGKLYDFTVYVYKDGSVLT